MKACLKCGGPVVPIRKGDRKIYCSVACKDAFHLATKRAANAVAMAARTCDVCGTSLAGRGGRAKTCSLICSRAAYRGQRASTRRRRWVESDPRCATCGESIVSRRAGSVYCDAQCQAQDPKWREYQRVINRKRLYGITPDQFDALLAQQGGACAICGDKAPSGKGNWHVDHCHATGEIRGLLCHFCNLMLGNAKDDPERLRAAIRYLGD